MKNTRVIFLVFLAWAAWCLGVLEVRGLKELSGAVAELAVPVSRARPADFAIVWLGRLAGLAVFLVFQAGCLAWGRLLAGIAARRRKGGAPLPLALPLGWGMVGLGAYACALCGLAFPLPLGALVVAPLPELWRRRRFRIQLPVPRIPRRGVFAVSGVSRAAMLACLVSLTLMLIAALAPETSGDPLTYDLGNARRTLGEHRFSPWPYSLTDQLHSLWETLLLPLLSVAGETSIRWFNPFLVALIAAGVFRLVRGYADPRWAWGGAALAATSPFLASHAVVAKNDLFVMQLSLTALLWAGRGAGAAGMAGFLAGCCFAAKYTGGYILPGLVVFLMAVRRGRREVVSRAHVSLILGFLAASLPVMSQRMLTTGNPIFPVGQGIFVSPFFDSNAAVRLQEHLHGLTRQDPELVSKWRNFEALWNPAGGEFTLLRWAVFLPAVLLAARISVFTRAAWAAFAALAAAWFLGPPQTRYAACLIPLGMFLAVSSLSGLPRRLKRAGAKLLAVALGLQLLHVIASPPLAAAWRAGAGLEAPSAYRARKLTSLDEFSRLANGIIGKKGRILSHAECRRAVFASRVDMSGFGPVGFPFFPLVHASRTPEEVWKRTRQCGWTHVLYNRLTAFFWRRTLADDPWTAADLALWARFWREHAELVGESPRLDLAQGYYYLYKLVPHAENASFAALPGIEGWVFTFEENRRAGRIREFREGLSALRSAAGDFAAVDVIEAGALRDELDPASRRQLLERAVARGWRSPVVYAELALFYLKEGRRREADELVRRAAALEPGRKWGKAGPP